jgi:FtsZ-binding cell division protein ZapB
MEEQAQENRCPLRKENPRLKLEQTDWLEQTRKNTVWERE